MISVLCLLCLPARCMSMSIPRSSTKHCRWSIIWLRPDANEGVDGKPVDGVFRRAAPEDSSKKRQFRRGLRLAEQGAFPACALAGSHAPTRGRRPSAAPAPTRTTLGLRRAACADPAQVVQRVRDALVEHNSPSLGWFELDEADAVELLRPQIVIWFEGSKP